MVARRMLSGTTGGGWRAREAVRRVVVRRMGVMRVWGREEVGAEAESGRGVGFWGV